MWNVNILFKILFFYLNLNLLCVIRGLSSMYIYKT